MGNHFTPKCPRPTHFTEAFTQQLPTMQYSTVAQIAAQSALSTLQILDRQGRKDARKVARFTLRTYRFFACSQALATYRALWQLLQILCMIAVALGMSARALVDALIAAQQLPAATVNGSQLPDPWEFPLEPCEPPTEPAIPALPVPAQPIALLPAARTTEPAWKSLSGEAKKRALRAACVEAGIQWRKRQGKGWKCLTIAQMESALG